MSVDCHTQLLVVIGGGAAGFFAAIQAKTMAPELAVQILEAAPKCLGKVKISGGGRCNVTHHCFDVGQLVENYPRGQKELKSVFSRFNPEQTMQWFKKKGVALKTESDNRVFPTSDHSQTIIDCLETMANKLGIKVNTQTPVEQIIKNESTFTLKTKANHYEANYILLATGSNPKSYGWCQHWGHNIVQPVPSLFTFKINDPRLSDLAGVSFQNVDGVLKGENEKPIVQRGPLLITHWGLSGPCVLRLSAWGARVLFNQNYQAALKIDFFPEQTQDELKAIFKKYQLENPKKQVVNGIPVTFPKRAWERWLHYFEIALDKQWGALSQKEMNRLIDGLKFAEFKITGKGAFKDEFVTAGGISRSEINFKTMQSKLCSGLYFAGEIIDIDGLTGGFNFQNAWATGWIAGHAIAESFNASRLSPK